MRVRRDTTGDGQGRSKKDTLLFVVLPVIGIIFAVSVLLYPTVQDLIAQYNADHVISMATGISDNSNDPERLACLENAQEYNASLSHTLGNVSTDDIKPYEEQLVYKGTKDEPMGTIIIPSISARLPIYHGDDDVTLSAGVGHRPSSSLPVGGESSHCVLEGHTGLQDARMFDDVVELKQGDRFYLQVLGDVYAYEVDGTEVVLPNEIDSLGIQEGKDLCTLVTCYPYGVNTHRLLVHAHRVEYSQADRQAINTASIIHVDDHNRLPLILAGVIAGGGVVTLIIIVVRRRKRTIR